MTDSVHHQVPKAPLSTLLNFRDVGQHINQITGQALLKEGLLYRSARPDNTSSEDRQLLRESYKIKTIIDLRSKTELLDQARKFASNQDGVEKENVDPSLDYPFHIPGIRYEMIDLNGGAYTRALLWKLSWSGLAKLLAYFATGYRVEALSIMSEEVIRPGGLKGLGTGSLDYSKAEIRHFFSVMADEEKYPIMMHCTQGKDRTGLLILLILLLLDVPKEAIQTDYMATERNLAVERKNRLKEVSRIGLGGEFVDCSRTFTDDMTAHIDENCGGLEAFFDGCGVDIDMRNRIKTLLKVTGGANDAAEM